MQNKSIAIVYNTSSYMYISRLNLIHKLQELGYKVYAIAPYDAYTEKLKEQGLHYIPLKMDNKGSNPIKDFRLTVNLYSIYKKLAPDIILHFTIKPNIYGSIAARFAKIPVINNITGLGTVFLKENFLQMITTSMYRIAFIKVQKVFFQNNDDKSLFLKKNIVKVTKIDLLPGSGVDTTKFYPQKKIRPSTNIIFLIIARVIRDKGIIEYVEAAKIIKRRYKNVEFQILGELGSLNRSSIKSEEVHQWQEKKTINYLGTTLDVREYIANADCIVLPSYREGTSKTLLEAASMARPIIASDVPGCNNVVSDGENGFLCKVKNIKDLADKMELMLKLPVAKRESMGNKGRKKMIAKFEETIVIKKYIEAINAILGK